MLTTMALLMSIGGAPAQEVAIQLPLMAACGTEAVAACRVVAAVTADEAARRLGPAVETHWIEDGVLHAVARRESDAVMLCCAVQSAMERVQGTDDLWAIAVRIADLDRAILDISVLPSLQGVMPVVWRGPDAPPEAVAAEIPEAAITRISLKSAALGERREVFVYRPEGPGPMPVIYLGDGESVYGYAGLVAALVAAGAIPQVILVGLASGPADREGIDPQTLYSRRHVEYLYGWDEAAYAAHERFLLEEVMPMAEAMGASTEARDRVVAGQSDGASWAIGMVTAHPDLFGGAIALSFGDYGPWLEERADKGRFDSIYLAAGVLEEGFHEDTVKAADRLRFASDRVRLEIGVAGHSNSFWRDRFSEAAVWMFGPERRRVIPAAVPASPVRPAS